MRLAATVHLAASLLALCCAAGCSEAPPTHASTAAEAEVHATALERWVHPSGLVSFVLPAGWAVAKATNELVAIDPAVSSEPGFVGSISIAFAQLAPDERGLPLESLHAVYERGLHASLPKQGIAILGREGDAEVVGPGAIRGRWKARSELGPLLLDTVIHAEDGCYATVDLMCLDSARSRFAAGMDLLATGLALDAAAIRRVALEARPSTPDICADYELAQAVWQAEEERYSAEIEYWQRMQGNFPGNDLPMPADKDMQLYLRAENLRLRCAAARQATGGR